MFFTFEGQLFRSTTAIYAIPFIINSKLRENSMYISRFKIFCLSAHTSLLPY